MPRWIYTHVHYINLGGQFQCGKIGKGLPRVRLVAEATQTGFGWAEGDRFWAMDIQIAATGQTK
jgi:hypothetical protein